MKTWEDAWNNPIAYVDIIAKINDMLTQIKCAPKERESNYVLIMSFDYINYLQHCMMMSPHIQRSKHCDDVDGLVGYFAGIPVVESEHVKHPTLYQRVNVEEMTITGSSKH